MTTRGESFNLYDFVDFDRYRALIQTVNLTGIAGPLVVELQGPGKIQLMILLEGVYQSALVSANDDVWKCHQDAETKSPEDKK